MKWNVTLPVRIVDCESAGTIKRQRDMLVMEIFRRGRTKE